MKTIDRGTDFGPQHEPRVADEAGFTRRRSIEESRRNDEGTPAVQRQKPGYGRERGEPERSERPAQSPDAGR